MRARFMLSAGAAVLLLAGCGAASPSPSATNGGPPEPGPAATVDASGLPIGGSTDVGRFGDPCALLTVDEIQEATGTEVLAIVRGPIESDDDPSQLCAWTTDGPGVANAAMLEGLSGASGSQLGGVVQSIEGAGGVVGVLLDEPDLDDDEDIDTTGGDETPPEVEIVQLTLGMSSAAVATPNGGYGNAITTDGSEQVAVMNLIGAQTTTEAMTDLITAAFNRL